MFGFALDPGRARLWIPLAVLLREAVPAGPRGAGARGWGTGERLPKGSAVGTGQPWALSKRRKFPLMTSTMSSIVGTATNINTHGGIMSLVLEIA